MRKGSIAITTILGLSAFAASILVGQQQEVQTLSLGSLVAVESSPTSKPSQGAPSPEPSPSVTAGGLLDGTYNSAQIRYKYGTIQLGLNISNGAIASIDLLRADTKGRGYDKAPPVLVQQAIKAQGLEFGNLTGATYVSEAFKEALGNALDQATQK